MSNADHRDGLAFLSAYNRCFYNRDIDALRALYATNQFTLFWDNHPGCDSINLEDHFAKVSAFFAKGKKTESGTIEPLLVEDPKVHATQGTLLVTAILRYARAPRTGVRSTFVLVDEAGQWKAIHIHHSFDPNP